MKTLNVMSLHAGSQILFYHKRCGLRPKKFSVDFSCTRENTILVIWSFCHFCCHSLQGKSKNPTNYEGILSLPNTVKENEISASTLHCELS